MPYTMFTVNGATIGGTMQYGSAGWGWILQGTDPNGGMFELHQAAVRAPNA